MLGNEWNYANEYDWMARVRAGMDPVIICCAVNGGIQGKETHPALPESPEEIAEQAHDAYEAGAAIVHIHGRRPDDPVWCSNDPEVYQQINALVRAACPEIIINNTTGGDPRMDMEGRKRTLEAEPEMASLNMGPDMSRFVIPARRPPLPHAHEEIVLDGCMPFTYGVIEELAQIMRRRQIKPEMEVYNPGQFWATNGLIEGGLISPPYVHQFVMGSQTNSYPTPQSLLDLVRLLPPSSTFFVCGIGPFQLPMTTLAMLLGGHVRVGLEDNLYYRRGRKTSGNGELVARAARLAEELNRGVATSAQARTILGLDPVARAFELPALRSSSY